MLNQLKSVIEGYSDHKNIDAGLIQEAVQNSKDAPKGGVPQITFKLEKFMDGDRLIITDENTTGLSGKKSSDEELSELMQDQIDVASNWDAFFSYSESTKSGDNSAGSRGQGKAALLYHSLFEIEDREKMMLIVDTLTEDENKAEVYRAQVKYLNPEAIDVFYVEGKKEVANFLTEIDFSKLKKEKLFSKDVFRDSKIKLNLKPLKNRGTRMTIPYLNPETADKFRDKLTMKKWAERIWWKAIQDNEIKIIFDIDGKKEEVKVLDEWISKPWDDEALLASSTDEKGIFIFQDIILPPESSAGKDYCKENNLANLKIENIVFSWDLNRKEDELIKEADRAELTGVQWLRNNQWIMTYSIKDILDQQILKIENLEEFKNGFRGFITFDKNTEMFLREPKLKIENPQHSNFDPDNKDVQQIKRVIRNLFNQVALEMNWNDEETSDEDLEQFNFKFLEELGIFGSGNKEIKDELNGLIGADFGKNLPLKWGDTIQNISTKIFTINERKSLESVIYPSERVRPLRPSGTQPGTRWTEVESELCYIIYNKHGASSLKRNYPMVRDFLMFSGRELNILEAQCLSYKSLDDPPGGLNASELAKNTYEKLVNKNTSDLEEIFNSTILEARTKKKEDDLIKTSLYIKTPSELIHLQDVEKFQDLSKKEIIEDAFKDLKIDKKTYFKEKGKYSLVVIWKDAYGYELQKKERSFYVEEGKKDEDPSPFTPIVKIRNTKTDEITKYFNYEDEFEITVEIRNRTEKELHFGLDVSFDNNDLSEEVKYIVPPKEKGYEHLDQEIFSFKGTFVTEETNLDNGRVAVQKGKISARFDFWDITERDLEIPLPIDLRTTFTPGVDVVGVYKDIFIEENQNSGAPFKMVLAEGSGNGNPIWKFNNNYLDREDVNVEVFREHPEKIRAENTKKEKSYNFNSLKKRIGCEATAALFIDNALVKNDKSYIIDALDAVDNVNVKSSEPFDLYKDTLFTLEKLNYELIPDGEKINFYFKLENLKKQLSSSLLFMSYEL